MDGKAEKGNLVLDMYVWRQLCFDKHRIFFLLQRSPKTFYSLLYKLDRMLLYLKALRFNNFCKYDNQYRVHFRSSYQYRFKLYKFFMQYIFSGCIFQINLSDLKLFVDFTYQKLLDCKKKREIKYDINIIQEF